MLPGNIELCIAIQALEVGKIHLSPLKLMEDRNPKPGVDNRPIAPLSYLDSGISLPCLSILLPSLKITRWDPKSGRLDLDLSQSNAYVQTKLNTLQDYIVSTVFMQQGSWLGRTDLDHDTVRSLLQPLISGTTLTLFLHGPNPTLKPAGRAWIYHKGPVEPTQPTQPTWSRGSRPSTFTVGQEARVCVRLHGLCLIYHPANPIPKFRIQHQVISCLLSN